MEEPMFWELKICRFSRSKSCRILLLGFKHGLRRWRGYHPAEQISTVCYRAWLWMVSQNSFEETLEKYEIDELRWHNIFHGFHMFSWVSVYFTKTHDCIMYIYIYIHIHTHYCILFYSIFFWEKPWFPDVSSGFSSSAHHAQLRQRRSRSLHRHGLKVASRTIKNQPSVAINSHEITIINHPILKTIKNHQEPSRTIKNHQPSVEVYFQTKPYPYLSYHPLIS